MAIPMLTETTPMLHAVVVAVAMPMLQQPRTTLSKLMLTTMLPIQMLLSF